MRRRHVAHTRGCKTKTRWRKIKRAFNFCARTNMRFTELRMCGARDSRWPNGTRRRHHISRTGAEASICPPILGRNAPNAGGRACRGRRSSSCTCRGRNLSNHVRRPRQLGGLHGPCFRECPRGRTRRSDDGCEIGGNRDAHREPCASRVGYEYAGFDNRRGAILVAVQTASRLYDRTAVWAGPPIAAPWIAGTLA